MSKHAAKTPAKPRLCKVATPEIKPLTKEELNSLTSFLREAHDSNLRLVACGAELDDVRRHMRVVQAGLSAAESRMAEERKANAEIHKAITPLLHRLPA